MRRRRIFILGITGMLGRYIYEYFKTKDFELYGFSRKNLDASEVDENRLMDFIEPLEKDDVVINCMGTIKPMVDKHGDLNAIKVNSIFPRLLANVCEAKEVKLIHITSDCVFSGKDGNARDQSKYS